MNKTSANEWLKKAYHDLKSAQILYSADHIEESYPIPNKSLPPREEIKEILDYAEALFERVCSILDINLAEVKG